MNRAVVLGFTLSFAACATVPQGDVEELKPTAERFNQRIRWKDFRGAAELIVAEKRGAFIKARMKLKDDQDLTISDVELEDAQVAPDLLSASVVSRIHWYRLPNATEKTAVVSNLYVWREGTWQLESQDDGPFEELLPAASSAADAGVEP